MKNGGEKEDKDSTLNYIVRVFLVSINSNSVKFSTFHQKKRKLSMSSRDDDSR